MIHTKLLFGLLVFLMSSCYVGGRHSHLPPGQAKKVYGEKSAKRFAPGQQKKKKGHGHHKMDVLVDFR